MSIERRILLNPGPATTSATVKNALLTPDVCPREEEFCARVADVRTRLARIAGDPAEVAAVPVTGSGTAALEAALTSFVPDDGAVLIVDNGDYGARLGEIARIHGIDFRVVSPGWGAPVEPSAVERAAAAWAGRATHLFFVHHETSSGLLNPYEALTQVAQRQGLAVLVDAMSSFGALPTPVGSGGADAVVSSANKCLQGMAGVSFVVATRTLLEQARRTTPRSLVLDLGAEFEHLEKTGQTRFTSPPQLYAALQQALVELEAEGLEARGERYAESMKTLVEGMHELGFEPLLREGEPSQILVSLRDPSAPWFDFVDMHDALYREGFTIYPGKPSAEPSFRLSVLGDIDRGDIERFLNAVRRYLDKVR